MLSTRSTWMICLFIIGIAWWERPNNSCNETVGPEIFLSSTESYLEVPTVTQALANLAYVRSNINLHQRFFVPSWYQDNKEGKFFQVAHVSKLMRTKSREYVNLNHRVYFRKGNASGYVQSDPVPMDNKTTMHTLQNHLCASEFNQDSFLYEAWAMEYFQQFHTQDSNAPVILHRAAHLNDSVLQESLERLGFKPCEKLSSSLQQQISKMCSIPGDPYTSYIWISA